MRLDVEVQGRGDDVDVLGDMGRDAVLLACDMTLTGFAVLVDVILGLEQALDFRNRSLKLESVKGTRGSNVDETMLGQPLQDCLAALVARSKGLGDLFNRPMLAVLGRGRI